MPCLFSFGIINSLEAAVFSHFADKLSLNLLLLSTLTVFLLPACCYRAVLKFLAWTEGGQTHYIGLLLFPGLLFLIAKLDILQRAYGFLDMFLPREQIGQHIVLLLLQVMGLEALLCTLYAYRQRFFRVRKKMADFLSEYWGEYGKGICHCASRVNYAIQNHRITPDQLDFIATKPSNAAVEIKAAMEEIDRYAQQFSFCRTYPSTERLKRILIIEDDALLNKTLAYNLISDGWDATPAPNARAAENLLAGTEFDLVPLDINLPGGSGYDLCELIKTEHPDTVVIFLAANEQENDQIWDYAVGTGDYITKPFSMKSLQRKICVMFVILERCKPAKDLYENGGLFLDFSEQTASLNGKPLTLLPMEFKMLYLYCKNSRQILTRQRLLERLWGVDEKSVEEHTLTTAISRIRGKIEAEGDTHLKAIYGIGYSGQGRAEMRRMPVKTMFLLVKADAATAILALTFLLSAVMGQGWVLLVDAVLTACALVLPFLLALFFAKWLSQFTSGLRPTRKSTIFIWTIGGN